MKYEKTPIKKLDRYQLAVKSLDNMSTTSIIWHLIKRHRFALVSAWAITMTIVYMFPPAFDVVFSLVK